MVLLAATGALGPQSNLRNPCFRTGMPIIATEMWKTLEAYTEDTVLPPPRRYGTCAVDRMNVTSEEGILVATLGCGVLILAPGIRDPYGIEVGQDGGAVFSRRQLRPVECSQDGPAKVRCQFWRKDETNLEPFWYGVAGRIDENPTVESDMVLTGKAAQTFFMAHKIVEIVANVKCN